MRWCREEEARNIKFINSSQLQVLSKLWKLLNNFSLLVKSWSLRRELFLAACFGLIFPTVAVCVLLLLILFCFCTLFLANSLFEIESHSTSIVVTRPPVSIICEFEFDSRRSGDSFLIVTRKNYLKTLSNRVKDNRLTEKINNFCYHSFGLAKACKVREKKFEIHFHSVFCHISKKFKISFNYYSVLKMWCVFARWWRVENKQKTQM